MINKLQLSRHQTEAIKLVEKDDLSDPIELIQKLNFDPSVFFEGHVFDYLDFRKSDIDDISFEGTILRYPKLWRDQYDRIKVKKHTTVLKPKIYNRPVNKSNKESGQKNQIALINSIFLTEYINAATNVLSNLGLTVRLGQNFEIYRRIIANQSERYMPEAGFSPERYQSNELDGIWLVGYSEKGELVHTQACRRISIAPNLETHLRTRSNDYFPKSLKFNPDKMEFNLSPDASKISGNAIYHGDAWLKSGPDGIRGGPALPILSRMMIAKVMSLWDTEHIFSFVSPNTALKGLPQRYGYTRCEQAAVRFLDLTTMPNDLWLTWMTKAEAQVLLRLRPSYFKEIYESSNNQTVGRVA